MKTTVALALALTSLAFAEERGAIVFETLTLSRDFHSEGAAVGDFNKDGIKDVVSGPFIYLGPGFKETVQIYQSQKIDVRSYSKNFLCYVHDLNSDGYDDVIVMGFPGEEGYWFENPQGRFKPGAEGAWKKWVVFQGLDNESPTFRDLTGDGKPEIVCSFREQFGYAEPAWNDPTQPWAFTALSPPIPGMGRFTHGLGIGDVNKDGRQDLLWKDGWWEHPADKRTQPMWPRHDFKFGGGGAQMFASDFDGDGDNDVLTSLAAHAYGLSWFENLDGKGTQFKEHLIVGDKAETSPTRVAFSQHHSIDVADFDGDGVSDFVTGKRWFAHNGGDPGGMDPGVIYWFRTVRKGGAGKVDFEPHFIHDDSGVGTEVMAADMNADNRPDIVVGSKKGTFVHLQRRVPVDVDGFRSLFDGPSLAGWEGDPKYWRVENGTIVGESTRERPLAHNTFLLWRGGRLADFKLRLKFRLTGVLDANSGVQFRCQDEGNFDVKGYQADIDNAGGYVGVLWDEDGRGPLGPRGLCLEYARDGTKTREEKIADSAAISKAYKPGEWNEYTITAAGEHIVLKLNGIATTKVVDRAYIDREPNGNPKPNQPKEERELYGHLALQLHSGGPTKIEWKDIRLKELPGAVEPVESE
ncbi:MAG: family 16 glycoside hydrolase [Verrucomicrobiales bacterium]